MVYIGGQTAGQWEQQNGKVKRRKRDSGMAGGGILNDSLRDSIKRLCPKAVHWNEPMSAYSTLKVGGPAWAMVKPESEEAFAAMVKMLGAARVPWWVIGRGSNILVPDEGLPGVVLVMGRQFGKIAGPVPLVENDAVDGQGKKFTVSVQAGCSLARLLQWAIGQELSGLEFVAGIPGSLGGAVRMNAGAWGRQMSDCVRQVRVLDEKGVISTIAARNMGFGYRAAAAVRDKIVLGAELVLSAGDRLHIEETCQDIMQQRLAKQPLQTANAGSFFKNPVNHAAGRLIEQAGLKGFQHGGAMISSKHANFIVNLGEASAADIHELMLAVQQRVYSQTGILLEPEVRLLGNWNGE